MHRDVGMPVEFQRRLARMQQVIRIHAMNHVYVMPLVAEGVRQAIQLHAVTAEAVRRIKRAQVQKIKGAAHDAATFWITDIIWRAASSHVSRPAAARAEARIRARKSLEESTASSAVAISSTPVSTYMPPPPSKPGSGLAFVAITGQPQAAA